MTPPKRIVKKQLGELLVERGVLTAAHLEEALQVQKEKGGLLGRILVSMGYVKEQEVAQTLTLQYGCPYLPLENVGFDPEIAKLIPESVAREHNLILIDKIGKTLTMAISDPLNSDAIEDIELLTKHKVQIFVGTKTEITRAIDTVYGKR